jgi:F-type H+-transporting ATPase subunit gamma
MSRLLAIAVVLAACVQAFVPTSVRSPRQQSTVVMDGKSRVLRDRIKSVKNTRRITEAMRLVAAARVRRAQDAVLRTRPLLAQLQQVRVCMATFE